MNVAIYVRVSTQEQKLRGISVEAQEADCRAWVEKNGHTLAGVYNDAGLSARARYTKRRAMLRLLSDIEAGTIELVIFTKLDRWFRSIADYYEVQTILEAHGVRWRAIREDYETETASGRLKVNIMLAVAQDEADRTSERIRAAAAYKRQCGEVTGRPPVGYVIRDKRFAVDTRTEPGLRAFFETYLHTLSVRDAVAEAARHGVRLTASHAGRILRSPVYRGDAHGVPCPAYLTPAQAGHIDANAARRVRKPAAGRVFLFTGLLTCGACGGRLSSAAVPSAHRLVKYYRCENHARDAARCAEGCHVNEEKLERYLLETLAPALDRYDVRCRAVKLPPAPETAHCSAATERSRTAARLARLLELYIDGEITREDYDRRAAPLRAALASETEADETADDHPSRPPAASEAAPDDKLPPHWRDAYDGLSAGGRRLFWKRSIRGIVIQKGRPPLVDFFDAPLVDKPPNGTARIV